MRMGHHGQKKKGKKRYSPSSGNKFCCVLDGTLAHLVLYDISSKKWKWLAASCQWNHSEISELSMKNIILQYGAP